jgi:hypothetical protein
VLNAGWPTIWMEYVLDLSAITAQCITIELVSFGSRHLGQRQTFFHEHGLAMIKLKGLGGPFADRLSLSLQTARLSRPDKILNNPVMVLTRQTPEAENAQKQASKQKTKATPLQASQSVY